MGLPSPLSVVTHGQGHASGGAVLGPPAATTTSGGPHTALPPQGPRGALTHSHSASGPQLTDLHARGAQGGAALHGSGQFSSISLGGHLGIDDPDDHQDADDTHQIELLGVDLGGFQLKGVPEVLNLVQVSLDHRQHVSAVELVTGH